LSRRYRKTALVAALAAVLVVFTAGSAAATDSASSQSQKTSYYLALGDSLAIGVQPDAAGDIHPTDSGYPDLLHAELSASDPDLQLVKLGCSGETTTTFVKGGRCSYGAFASQLQAAAAFLLTHRGDVDLVTINLGGNDIAGCADLTGIDAACVAAAMSTIETKLTIATIVLRAVAGGGVPIVGSNFHDPFLAFWLFGPGGQEIAQASLPVTADVNNLVEGIYEQIGAPVADVESAFQTFVTTPLVPLPGIGEVPLNVARICQWTFMCVPPPVGPDFHPTDAGYQVMADAFAAKV